MSNILEENRELLEKAIDYYFSEEEQIKYFGTKPKSRYDTFKYCHSYYKNNEPLIVELGTSRSFVDGRFEGCNLDDIKYWDPNNSEKWDWSAGCFTKVFSNLFPNSEFHTVDINKNHIKRSKIMNSDRNNVNYHISSSEDFLNSFDKKIDLLYLDTGDMTPIEDTAQLHLREAKIIVEKKLLSENGLILIDDVKSVVPKKFGEKSDLGKAKYSIEYFLENGYEIIMDEYQYILRKKLKICNNLFVDKVYCLYLKEYPDRKKNAENEFIDKKINVKMFQGIYNKKNPHTGCKLGHLNIIKEAKKNKYKNILICEDDIEFLNSFPLDINVPEKFGLFYLSYYDYDNLSIIDENSESYCKNSKYNLIRLFYSRSTLSYIVNETLYDDIIEFENKNSHYWEFIDMSYAIFIQNKFPCYGLYPLCALPKRVKSIINPSSDFDKIRQDIEDKAKKTFEKKVDKKFYELVNSAETFFVNDIMFNNFYKN